MINFKVKIINRILQILTLAVFPVALSAQSAGEMKKIFEQAESYYVFEEYEMANQLYLLLDSKGNSNVEYKIGTCYLNIPGEKEKSIEFLENAVKNASYDSKTQSFKEKRAPLDVYFSLSRAYLINDQLDKALNTLETFDKLAKETASKGGMKNEDYIDQQIEACKNAIQYKENPVTFSRKNLGKNFSQGSVNDNPAVSFDGNSIVYTERRGIANAIFYSVKNKGVWQPPVEITSQLNAGEDCSSCSLNSDGTELFIYKTENYDGAIYSSSLVNGSWSPIKKLNRYINTKYYESHAAISADGKKLYFTSNREGGQGNLDIYVSVKDATGDWGQALNLGAEVNTPFNEDTPFITQGDSILYFSSEGHSSMGGFDIFSSGKNGDTWKTPVNLGYPLNTTDDDKFLQPSDNGKTAYFSMTSGYKEKQINYIGLGNFDVNRPYELKGKFSLMDTVVTFDKNYSVIFINNTSGDTLDVIYPDKYTGQYSIPSYAGKFRLIYRGTGYMSQVVDTLITTDITSPVLIDVVLRPENLYGKIDLAAIRTIESADSSTLIRNLNVTDVGDVTVKDSDILYYTVQVMALYNPVDVKSFAYIDEIKILYNDKDKFYRYTVGTFQSREEADELRSELIRKGYPKEIFIKKVSK